MALLRRQGQRADPASDTTQDCSGPETMDDNKTMKNLMLMMVVLAAVGIGCGLAATLIATPGV